MNRSIIVRIIGYVIMLEGIFMLLPSLVGLIYSEKEGVYYLACAGVCMLLGALIAWKKPDSQVFYLKEGCVTTSFAWITLSFFGCFPLWLSGDIPNFVDALFETVSGFTTTGSTILSDVEALSHASLFWRSFTHWIGGMGVLVFILAIMPMSGGATFNFMKAESTGASVGKLVPKVKYTARILYLIYAALTVLEFILLKLGKMPWFDSICTAISTAGTGGFGIKNDSIGGYSAYIQWVVLIFMILFGVTFTAYYLMLFGNIRKAFAIEEVKVYFVIIIAAVAVIFYNLAGTVYNTADALRHAAFQVATLVSSTGFATADFEQWNATCKTVLLLLMVVGACAGSTGGGIKVSRFIIIVKSVVKEIQSYLFPKSVKKIKMDDKPVEHEVVRAVNVYFMVFMLVFAVSVILLSFNGYDMTTNITAVLSELNNMGPGLALIGPTENFGFFSNASKFVLMFDMIAGRLELFPILVLFHPNVWKELFAIKSKHE